MTRRARARDAVGHCVAGLVGPLLVRIMGATCRLVVAGEERLAGARAGGAPVLFTFWHGRLLPLTATHRRRGIVALVSEHSDGEYIRRVIEPLGFGVVRGSTTRGGARALFEMSSRAREGHDLAVAPDGPRGPRRTVRDGVVALARRASVALVPVGAASRPAVLLPTWDGFVVPLPGARISVVYGAPLAVPASGPDDTEALGDELASRIEEATSEAEALLRRARPGRGGAALHADDGRGPYRRGALLATYRLVTGAIYLALWPALALLARVSPERWATRHGGSATLARPTVRPIWVHAASVGELIGARPLVEALAGPARDRVVLTTMTPTALAIARRPPFAPAPAHLVPFDFPQAVARHVDALAPRALVIAETELWPNLLDAAIMRGVPVAIVNARISDRTFARYRRLRPALKGLLSRVAWIAAQSPVDRERFAALGARESRIDVVGSTKEDGAAAGRSRDDARRALGAPDGDLLLVFGSARTGEDAVFLPLIARLLAARPRVRVLYAPRHVERTPTLAARAAEHGLAPLALSARRARGGDSRYILLDTLGELSDLYAGADVAVIGGSFAPHGGHNPLEAARHGVPLLMGPHTQNVRGAIARLEESGGARVVADGAGLERELLRLVDDRGERIRRAEALCGARLDGDAVTERVLAGLVRYGVAEAAVPAWTVDPGDAL